MKTITYKIENTMKSIVASLIILASLSGIAQGANSNTEAVAIAENGYNAKVFVEADLASETAKWISSNVETNDETIEALAFEPLKYNAKKFVEADLAIENSLNTNDEAGLALQVETLKYNPKEFVEADLAFETSSNNNADSDDQIINFLTTNNEYNAKDFVEAELSIEIKNWRNNSTNSIKPEDRFNCENELANN